MASIIHDGEWTIPNGGANFAEFERWRRSAVIPERGRIDFRADTVEVESAGFQYTEVLGPRFRLPRTTNRCGHPRFELESV